MEIVIESNTSISATEIQFLSDLYKEDVCLAQLLVLALL